MGKDEEHAVQIRPAEPGDAAPIAKVQYRAWQSAYQGIMPDDFIVAMDVQSFCQAWSEALNAVGEGRYLVATLGDEVIGFATYGPARESLGLSELKRSSCAELVALNVLPDYWRLGVGAKLLARACSELSPTYRQFYLWVVEANQRARQFYLAQGCQLDGATKHNANHGGIVERRYVLDI